MKKIVLILFVVVLMLAMAIPVFADPGNPNGPPPCDLGAAYDLVPGQGVKGNIENMTGPFGPDEENPLKETPGRDHMFPKWNYDGGPGNANVTCWFAALP